MSITTDRNHPDLGHGVDTEPVDQNKAYLVLSDEERAKGFVRPVRHTYKHVGPLTPLNLRKLTPEEKTRYEKFHYVAFEEYPADRLPVTGRF